jgi:hypothetical protein
MRALRGKEACNVRNGTRTSVSSSSARVLDPAGDETR